MRLLPLALVGLLLIAGCASPHHANGTVPVPLPIKPFTVVQSLITNTSGFGEPSLGARPDGSLWTDLGSNVYKSMDNGTTWTNTGDHQMLGPESVPNADPDLAVDQDGNVWEARLWLGCVAVAVSKDGGATWSSNPAVCPGVGFDREWIVPTKGGEAYVYAHQLPSFQQTAMKTTDYGATWLPTTLPEGLMPHFLLANGGSGWGGGGFWNPKTGSVWFTFTLDAGAAEGGNAKAGYSVTHDGGLSWEFAGAATLDGSALGLGLVTGAADDAGNVYLTWGEASGTNNADVAIYVAGSHDDGKTWEPKVRVDDGNGSKVFPEIMAGADGHVAVAYYEGSEHAYPDQMKGMWNVTLAYTDDYFAPNATWSHGQLASDVKDAPICISGTTCSGNREFDDYFGIARTPTGQVAVTYNVLPKGGSLRNGFALTAASLLGPIAKA